MYSGLHTIPNILQYKSTTVSVALQQYAVVCCDIDSYGGGSMLHTYTLFRIYLAT